MYTVYVGRGSDNNRDSKSQGAEFFHPRKNESHSYSNHGKWVWCVVDGEMGSSATYFVYFSMSPLVENSKPRKKLSCLNTKELMHKGFTQFQLKNDFIV